MSLPGRRKARCPGFRREGDESIHDGAIDCDYFLECVLPADWNLNDLVSYALWYDEADEETLPHGMKRCEICQNPFVPSFYSR